MSEIPIPHHLPGKMCMTHRLAIGLRPIRSPVAAIPAGYAATALNLPVSTSPFFAPPNGYDDRKIRVYPTSIHLRHMRAAWDFKYLLSLAGIKKNKMTQMHPNE